MFINSKSVICSAKNNVFFKNEIFVNRTQFQLQNFRLEKKIVLYINNHLSKILFIKYLARKRTSPKKFER